MQKRVFAYTDEVYADALIQQMQAMKDAFPDKVVIQYTNFPKSQLERLVKYQAEHCIGLGGPDINPFSPGLNSKNGIYSYYEGYAGKIPLGAAVQHEDYDLKKTLLKNGQMVQDYTVQDIFDFGKNRLHVNYIFWLDRPGYIEKVIEMLDKKEHSTASTLPKCMD